MRQILLLGVLAGCFLYGSAGAAPVSPSEPDQPAPSLQYEVAESSGHYNVLLATETLVEPETGETNAVDHKIIHLGSGLNYFDDATQSWQPSIARFELDAQGVAAGRVFHKTKLGNDPTQPGAVQLSTPDGLVLSSHLIGLALFDPVSGDSLLIAELKTNLQGQLLQPEQNRVLFADAFDSLSADLVYDLRQDSFAQDVVVHEQWDPGAWNFPPGSRLEIWTEFDQSPEPVRREHVFTPSDGQANAQQNLPELVDETLVFGDLLFGPGTAIKEAAAHAILLTSSREGTALVTKRFLKLEGRQFLVESLASADLAALTTDLPKPADKKQARHQTTRSRRAFAQTLPRSPTIGTSKPVQVAMLNPRPAGVILDYTILVGASSLTLMGGSTYLITNTVNVSTTLTIEGGAIVKYSTNASASLAAGGTVNCLTSPTRPALFTSANDNTIGETITGSTGSPANSSSGNPSISITSYNTDLHDLRVSYAVVAVNYGLTTYGQTLHDSQITRSGIAIQLGGYSSGGISYFGVASLRNILLHDSGTNIYGNYFNLDSQHLTVDTASIFYQNPYPSSSGSIYLTNSLLVGVPDPGSLSGRVDSPWFSSGASVFQTSGAGEHYQQASLTNRGSTTGLPPSLITDLQQRTVFPPNLLTNTVNVDTVLSPSVLRDTTSSVRLGYHYWPIDYVASNVTVTATLTLTNGVVLGVHGNYGLSLQSGSKLLSEGTPINLNQLVHSHAIQEKPSITGISFNGLLTIPSSAATRPILRLRFTEVSAMGPGSNGQTLINAAGHYFSEVSLTDCQLHGTTLKLADTTSGGSGLSVLATLTNNVFDRCLLYLSKYYMAHDVNLTVNGFNNLFYGGSINLGYDTDTTYNPYWNLKDNHFDNVFISQFGSGISTYLLKSNNGYQSTTSLGGSGNITLTNFPYATGTLGRWYQGATNLANLGSRNATNAGLYHYTTQTNQTKEASTTVDIGFHYVATDTNGQPFDTDGERLPDYFEDRNGNGTVNSGETNWQNPDSNGDGLTDWDEWRGGISGKLVGWGDALFFHTGPLPIPSGVSNVIGVSAGPKYCLAILPNQTVVAWGDNTYGQTNVPSWLNHVVAVAAGGKHAAALREDGTVVMWGTNNNHQLEMPYGLSGVKAIAAGCYHTMALKKDGTVVVWGRYGLDWGYTVPAGATNLTAIAAGFDHCLALRADGQVFGWGRDADYHQATLPAGVTNAAAMIAAASWKSLYWMADKRMLWGGPPSGGETNGPTSLTNVTGLATVGWVSYAQLTNRHVLSWGADYQDNLQAPADLDNSVYLQANNGPCCEASPYALSIRAGVSKPLIMGQPVSRYAAFGKTNGMGVGTYNDGPLTYQWKHAGTNLTGATNLSIIWAPVQTSDAGDYQVIVSNAAGSVTSRVATLTVIYRPEITAQSPLTNLPLLEGQSLNLWVEARSAGDVTQTYFWYKDGTNLLASLTATNYSVTFNTNSAASTVQGSYWVVVTNVIGASTSAVWQVTARIRGGAEGWGDNTFGKAQAPAAHGVWTNLIAITGGGSHSAALREDGTVVAWGDNSLGQTNVPSSATNVMAVSAGGYHTLALREDGTVVAWGDNSLGQTNVPSSATNVAGISAGDKHSLAWRKDGTAVSWGFNGTGQTTLPGSLGTNVIQLSGGLCHSLALLRDGSVVAWGNNTCGQMNIPASATNIVSLTAGPSHNLALRKDGIVVAWGDPDQDATVVPAGLSNVFSVAAGYNFSLALKNDGTVVGWGENANGQTAIPTYLGDTKAIAAGKYHSLSLRYNPTLNYPVTAEQDLLVVYNTNATDSVVLKNYYLQHRPMAANANVLGIGGASTPQELIGYLPDLTNNLITPVLTWLTNNPTKRPQYMVLLYGVPGAAVDLSTTNHFWASASYNLAASCPGRFPFVTHINMQTLADCTNYVNKLEYFGTNYSPGKLVISASKGGYSNTNYYFADVWWPPDYYGSYIVAPATNGVQAAGAPTNSVNYRTGTNNAVDGFSYTTNVAGFASWGLYAYTNYLSGHVNWSTNLDIQFTGSSRWYIIETWESYNGRWASSIPNPAQTGYQLWFSPIGFGGTGYSATPIGAISQIEEPTVPGINDPRIYFGLWQAKKRFAICAWNSVTRFPPNFPVLQAVGDPLTTK